MRSYPIDLEPEQVVQWLLEESHLRAFDLSVRATRSYQAGELAGGQSGRLGDEDREEIAEVAEVGLLEVTPNSRSGRWTLRLRVEDDIGPRTPEDEATPDEEEEMDVASFRDEFLRAGRGLPDLTAEARDEDAEASLERVLEAMVAHSRRPKAKRPD